MNIKPFSNAMHYTFHGTQMDNKGYGKRSFLYWEFRGSLAEAANIMADAVLRELGDGDNENGGSGSLENCRGDIFNAFMSTGHYEYADCRFEIIPLL